MLKIDWENVHFKQLIVVVGLLQSLPTMEDAPCREVMSTPLEQHQLWLAKPMRERQALCMSNCGGVIGGATFMSSSLFLR